MSKLYVGEEYTVKPSSIRFDQGMVEFSRFHNEVEYTATKLSIAGPLGQTTPICINDKTGLCEDGRQRVQICEELGINVKCVQVDGTVDKATRLELYNLHAMSGRDLTPAQKAIQAYKFILLTGQTAKEGASKFKSTERNVGDAVAIAGFGRTDILDAITTKGEWVRPTGGKPVKSLRTIAQELRAGSEKLKEVEETTQKIDYEAMINTEKGKLMFWDMRTLMQMSQHEADMVLVKYLNKEYVLEVDQETGEIKEETK